MTRYVLELERDEADVGEVLRVNVDAADDDTAVAAGEAIAERVCGWPPEDTLVTIVSRREDDHASAGRV